jgi:hypothetical protein
MISHFTDHENEAIRFLSRALTEGTHDVLHVVSSACALTHHYEREHSNQMFEVLHLGWLMRSAVMRADIEDDLITVIADISYHESVSCDINHIITGEVR